jgi:hypothetical protein
MDLNIIINDQNKYNFKSIQSVLIDAKNTGNIQILNDHSSSFFYLKENSQIEIISINNEKNYFKTRNSEVILNFDKNVINIICSEIDLIR